ncbi:myoD family inhibitor domain-containing protein-like [Salvelinus alpinus]
MTTQPRTSKNEPDHVKTGRDQSPFLEGDVSRPTNSGVMSSNKVVVSGVRRLSTISEHEPDKVDTDLSSQDPMGGREWGGSSFSLCSNKHINNSSDRFSSFESHQPDAGDDCAAILLACLYCRFYDIVVMVPDTCERAVSRCFPSFKYLNASREQERGSGWCNCNVELDCSCCDSCQEGAELLELAMEISEVCYR